MHFAQNTKIPINISNGLLYYYKKFKNYLVKLLFVNDDLSEEDNKAYQSIVDNEAYYPQQRINKSSRNNNAEEETLSNIYESYKRSYKENKINNNNTGNINNINNNNNIQQEEIILDETTLFKKTPLFLKIAKFISDCII